MVKALLLERLEQALQQLFSTAPWAGARLQPFAGCTVQLDLSLFSMTFLITPTGIPRLLTAPGTSVNPLDPPGATPALGANPSASPDLLISLPPTALPLFLSDQAGALRQLHLQGNSGLAAEIGYLAKHFRPDLEELLSRVVGDTLAHRLGQALRQGRAWFGDSARRSLEAIVEYGTEEARWIPSRSGLQRFSSEVERLAQDVQRLERRLAGLI